MTNNYIIFNKKQAKQIMDKLNLHGHKCSVCDIEITPDNLGGAHKNSESKIILTCENTECMTMYAIEKLEDDEQSDNSSKGDK